MKRRITTLDLLEAYRDEHAPQAAAHQRVLRGFGDRYARGDVLDLSLDNAPEPPPTAAKAGAPAFTAAVLGAATAGLLAALLVGPWWLHRSESLTNNQRAGDRFPAANVAAPDRQRDLRGDQERQGVPATASPLEPIAGVPLAEPASAPLTSADPVARSRPAKRGRQVAERKPPHTSALPPTRKSSAPESELPPPPPTASASAKPAERAGIEAELQLIHAAQRALREAKPELALARLDEHAARFPNGELADMRAIARIMALCQAGELAQAHALSQQFLQHSPRSPYAVRVRTLCVERAPQN
jgi:hypothetical protein